MSKAVSKFMALTPISFDPFIESVTPDSLPLTDPQAEIWAAVQMGNDASCAYNQCFSLLLRGSLSIESMESALRQVLNRHDGLRVKFDSRGDCQKMAAISHIDLRLLDISQLTPHAKAVTIKGVLEAETTQPFDLASGPLLRATLVREQRDLHRLIVTVHHIVCDGWSSSILFSDLAHLYAADRYGLKAQLPPAASYQDYVVAEIATAGGADRRAHEDYWVEQYADSVPVLELPLDAPRPVIKTYNGSREKLCLDKTLYDGLKKLGAKHGCTLFVTLLAGFEALLFRLSDKEDFVIGVPMAGQTELENSQLIGHCVNMIPLRAKIDCMAAFSDHLKAVRRTFMDAQAHQHVTFGSLLRRLNIPRDASRTPLVNITFNIDRIGAPFDFGEIALESIESAKRFLTFDLSVNVLDNGRELVVECEYNTDLFKAATICRWLGHYKVLLEAAALNPEVDITELPLLSEADRHQLLVEWNDTGRAYPVNKCIHQLFEAQVELTPDALALVFNDQQLTYRELNGRANQLANYLKRLRVGRDVPVGICMERSVEMVVAILAVLKAGAAYVPLDPKYPMERLEFMLTDTGAPVLLTNMHSSASLPGFVGKIVSVDNSWDQFASEINRNVNSDVIANDLAYVIYTSGSTGKPKGVMIEHRNAVAFLTWAHATFTKAELAVVLASTSVCFDLSIFEVFAPLTSGGCVLLVENALALGERDFLIKPTLINTVPSVIAEVLRQKKMPDSIIVANLAGEPLKTSLVDEIYQQTAVRQVYDLYGPSETTTYSTVMRRTLDGIQSIGRPIANTEIYILDRRLNPVPVGVTGELYIGGAGVARGYLNRPELTAEKFLSNPFGTLTGEARFYRTGDQARYLEDGNIEYLGRIDHQVKIRGLRIELGEIETVLAEHPSVHQAAVHLWQVNTNDVRIVACCVPDKPGAIAPIILRKHLRARLPDYMIPQYFLPIQALPLTPNNKIDRRKLPVPVEGDSTLDRHESPLDPVETTIAEIWTKLIRPTRPIGRNDRFFEVGGYSLLGLQALGHMEQELGMKLDFRALFQESLADIAKQYRAPGVT
jgi:amino acid adenylation domain-containing protein